ncbi:hypothetical protein [Micromonospora endophytica]|uniref:Uncharacterized protein n=1 Tax=Micromonospora endophytica TaxID=515350 RepID=A0A2W2BXT7_9ACTN|nr:hypothetical protein [Micromonospora endophytica]PZF92115.1 hypothetical protein C1I93_20100 [Micromonospora endophytica]RIW42854.1 hypothetical protein D3H59_21755 [Micromonospora endophytica]
MKSLAEIEQEARQVKAALPGYIAIRDLAAAALTGMADDLGLDLEERDVRDLATAVVDAIHKPAELQGIAFACTVADMEVAANDRWLLTPAREKAKSDPDARKTLPYLEQHAEGAQKVRNELVERLARVGREWMAKRQPAAVVAMPPAEARAESRTAA